MHKLFDDLERSSHRNTVDDSELLLQHGCLWPTDDRVTQLFNAIRTQMVYRKLSGALQWHRVSSEAVIKEAIRGTPQEHVDEGTLRMYYDFGGFAAERQLLKLAAFITCDAAGIIDVTPIFSNVVQSTPSHQINSRVIELCSPHTYSLQEWLVERIRKYELERCAVRALYRSAHHIK